jgi:DNA-directed RNA polymerase subunit omega
MACFMLISDLFYLYISDADFCAVGYGVYLNQTVFINFFGVIFMARITVEDCLGKIPNRFELVVLTSKRAKQLFKGAKPLLETDNLEIVTALREIAAGKVRRGDSDAEVGSPLDSDKAFISPPAGEGTS